MFELRMRDLGDTKNRLSRLWWVGVEAVRGRSAVRTQLASGEWPPPDRIVAIGKAAASMAQGAHDHFGPSVPTLVVTKSGHADELIDAELGSTEIMEGSHPVPDDRSVAAGARLRDVVSECGTNDHLLVLVSGGASSLAELPAKGVSLDDIASTTSQLIASGADIHQINNVRRELSRLKGGGLLANFGGARVTVLAISDVRGDDIAVIGSGIGVVPDGLPAQSDTRIVASNTHARNAVAAAADSLGLTVLSNEETLYGDVDEVAQHLRESLAMNGEGIHILGGEPTLQLPPTPGRGGRNQHLALSLSGELAAHSASAIALVAGTDGTDGPTDDAGGWAAAHWWSDDAKRSLAAANSGSYLHRAGALFTTGPTGTNVMDLVVAVSRAR